MFAGSPFRSIGAVAGPVGDLIPLQADLYPVPFPAQYDSVDNIALPLEHLHRPLPVIGQPPLQNAGGKQFLPILAIHRPPPLSPSVSSAPFASAAAFSTATVTRCGRVRTFCAVTTEKYHSACSGPMRCGSSDLQSAGSDCLMFSRSSYSRLSGFILSHFAS